MPKEKTQETNNAPALVKKISTALLKDMPTGEKATVGGVVTGMETGTSNLGDWTAFTGAFGMKYGGKEFEAAKCFLPDIATDLIKREALNMMDETGETEFKIQFAVELVKEYSPPKAEGDRDYVWSVIPLGHNRPKSPLALALEGN